MLGNMGQFFLFLVQSAPSLAVCRFLLRAMERAVAHDPVVHLTPVCQALVALLNGSLSGPGSGDVLTPLLKQACLSATVVFAVAWHHLANGTVTYINI